MSNAVHSPSSGSRPPAFVALKTRFIRRTALATLAAAGLIGATAAVYVDPEWGVRYTLAAVWGLVFFALTPWIIKALLFEQRMMTGLGLIGFKLFWMALMAAACVRFSGTGAAVAPGTALIAGISTPLVVIVLRALGGGLREAAQTNEPAAAAGPMVKESH